ncbi:MAG: hypothetical protein JW703_00410 [Candidatus Diapherotrites archaeon]|nr:hypothetical protein [Candidatus Diapherotrites archaeon]
MNKFSLFVLILFLLFFCACSEQSEAERLACINYSSFYSNSVPDCSSSEDCLKKVKTAFSLETEFLSTNISWETDKYLFHTAKSWFYFSEAKKNLKEIYSSCVKGKEFSSTAKNANELSNNINQLFKEIDSSTKESIIILSLIDAELKEQDINLARETALFRTHSKVIENINQAGHPELKFGSDLYYASYLSRVKEFKSFLEIKEVDFIDSFKISVAELIEKFFPELKKKIPFKEFFVPLIAEITIEKVNLSIEGMILHDSVAVMKGISAQKAVEAIDGFVSAQNSSVAMKFISIIKEINETKKEFEKKIQEMINLSEKKINASEETLKNISFSFDEFTSEVLQELASNSGEVIVKTSETDFSLSSFKENEMKKINEIKLELNEFKIEKSTEKISLGQEYATAKKIYDETEKISKEIDYFSNEEKNSIYFLCESRVSEIKEIIYAFNQFSSNEIEAVASAVKFNIALFEKSSEEKKLELCPKIINKFIEFRSAENNEELFIENSVLESKECVLLLREMISSKILSDFRFAFEKLVLKENNYESLQECIGLKENMIKAVFGSKEFIEFEENLTEFEEIVLSLKLIPSAKNSYGLEKKLEFYSEFKKESKITEFLKKSNLTEEIIKETENAEKILKEELVLFIERNALIETGLNEAVKAGEKINSVTKIKLFNPSNAFEEKISVELKFSAENAELIYSSADCTAEFEKEKIIIYFISLPERETILEINSLIMPATLTETEKLISITQNKALFMKTITVNASQKISLLQIETIIPNNSSEISILRNSKLIEFEKTEEKLSFYLSQSENKDKIEVFYSFFNPIKTVFELSELKDETETEKEYTYKFKIENLLSEKIDLIELMPLLPSNNSIVSQFIENEKNISVKTENMKTIISVKNLQAKEKREFTLIVKTSQEKEFWENKFNELKEELLILDKQETAELLEKINALEAVFTTSKKNITEFTKLEKEANEIIKKSNEEKEKEAEFMLLRLNAEERLSEEIALLEENESISLQEKYSEMRALLLQADEAKSLGNIDLALSLIKSFSGKLIELPSSLEKDSFIERKNEITGKANSAVEKAASLGLERRLSAEKKELSALEEEFSSAITEGKLGSAEQVLQKMNEKEKELEENLLQEIQSEINKVKPKIMETAKKINLIPEKISELKELMNEFDKVKDLIDYVAPTTKERIESIEKEFKEIPVKELNGLIHEIVSLEEALDYENKLIKLNEFNEKYSDSMKKIDSLYVELNSSVEKIMQDSMVYFNLASKQASGEKALEALEKAKQAIEEKKFIKSIAFSKTAMLSASTGNEIDLSAFPIAVIPFILVVVGVIAFKWKQKQEDKKPKKKKKVKGI